MIKLNGKEVLFETFPNGETKMVESLINNHVDILLPNQLHFKYESDSDLIKLMFVKKYLDKIGVIVGLLVYYFPYSRMDRSENGSAFTLKYVAEFINDLMFDSVMVIEPHSDITPALLDNVDTIMITHHLLPEVIKEVGFDTTKDYIVFPDLGSTKRYNKLEAKNILVGHKHRDFETGKITSLELVGHYNGVGKSAIIVDDLTSYGTTFIKTGEKLKELGFENVYLLVGHAEKSVLHGDMFKSSSPITKVFTTDTIIHHIDSDNIKTYKIEELVQ